MTDLTRMKLREWCANNALVALVMAAQSMGTDWPAFLGEDIGRFAAALEGWCALVILFVAAMHLALRWAFPDAGPKA